MSDPDLPQSTGFADSPAPHGMDVPPPQSRSPHTLAPTQTCQTCGAEAGSGDSPTFVYALGRIQVRFPSVSLEKEFAQIGSVGDTTGLTDPEVQVKLLSDPQHRYLARQLCWVMTIEGLETYILWPHDSGDLDSLLRAIRPAPSPLDVDLVIGRRGPLAPPSMCNGLVVPIVAVDHIYSFDRDALIKSIPRPKGIQDQQAKQFGAIARDVFEKIMQLADNAGATDDHRAVNYLAVRYPAIYAAAAEAVARDSSLTGVEVRPSRLSGVRRIVDVIFAFTNRKAGHVEERFFVRVDVTEEFPFLVTGMAPFYDR